MGQKCNVPTSMLHPVCRPPDTMYPSWISVDETEEHGEAINMAVKESQVGYLSKEDSAASDGLPTTKIEARHVENMPVPQGGTYTGEVMHDNQPHGQGTQTWSDGTVYAGSWMRGAAHGQGDLSKADGSGYSGQWAEGRKHGIGRELLVDGSEYKGEFADGQKHGHGAFRWKGGASYSGNFCEDVLQGEGVFIWGDGRSYHGQWVQSKMHGQGRFEWPDGKVFEGKYENDQKHGSGMFLWPDGSKMIGVWQSGKQHGVGTHVTSKGLMRRGRWKNGNLEHWLDSLSECRREEPRNLSLLQNDSLNPRDPAQRPDPSEPLAEALVQPLPPHDVEQIEPEQDSNDNTETL